MEGAMAPGPAFKDRMRTVFENYLTKPLLIFATIICAFGVSIYTYFSLLHEDIHYDLSINIENAEINSENAISINSLVSEFIEAYSERESSAYNIEYYYNKMSSNFSPRGGAFSAQKLIWSIVGRAKTPSRDEKARIYSDLVLAPLKSCVSYINTAVSGQVEVLNKSPHGATQMSVTLKDIAHALSVRQIGLDVIEEGDLLKSETIKTRFEECRTFQQALRKKMESHFIDESTLDNKERIIAFLLCMKNLEKNINSAIIATYLQPIENLFTTVAHIREDIDNIVLLSDSARKSNCEVRGGESGGMDSPPSEICKTLIESNVKIKNCLPI
jgi:hypothetical protein